MALLPPHARRPVTVAVAVVALLVVARLGVRAGGAYWSERDDYFGDPHAVPRPPDAAVLGLQDVALTGRDGTRLRGWYIPSRNGAAIVLCHGSGGDRAMMLPDARPLAAAGFGVLLIDMPGNGESGGRVTYGAPARAAVAGALDFLARRPDVDSTRLGALGFSMGGYAVAQVAATDVRVRAVVLAGTPPDLAEQTAAEYVAHGRVAQWGALLALRLHGPPASDPRAIDAVGHIAPRPLAIVTGTDDRTVPPALVQRLFDAAHMPKVLWTVVGAGHGDYEHADVAYARRLREFFAQALAVPDTVASGTATVTARGR